MAQPYQIPPGEVEHVNTVWDGRGAQALQLRYREVVTIDASGQSKVYRDSEYVTLADGSVITAAMLGMGKVELAVCDLCRYPPVPRWKWEVEQPSLGVMLRKSGTICAGCSQFVCRRHARSCTDNFLRCILCWRQFGLGGLINWLLF